MRDENEADRICQKPIMPRKPDHPEARFQRAEVSAGRRARSRRRQPSAGTKSNEPLGPRMMDPLLRTGLLMAALRVWELKHGIHDCF